MNTFTLKYRASVDGFNPGPFHQKCDGVTRLLTLIQTHTGYVFGGFATAAYTSNDAPIADPLNTAFLYTLINPHGIAPTMLLYKGSGGALHGSPYHGPIYSCNDLYIGSNSNSDINSDTGSRLGAAYIDTTGKGNELFAGQLKLGLISEVLAFQV